ncbi:hypothetical protein [Flavobacterium sp. 3-210]
MKYFLVFFLLLMYYSGHSQKKNVSKNELLQAFKQTIVQTRKTIDTDSNPWFTDNTNGNYYKNDTISFKNAKSFKRNYCKIINWTFYKKDAFVIGDADYCNEPLTRKVTKPENWINLRCYNSGDDLIIELYTANKLLEKFKVISLQKNQSEYNKNEEDYFLKLVRLYVL